MDWPVRAPTTKRITGHLETLPFELIDAILKDVTFIRALDLLISPYSGQRLREAIRSHWRWRHLLGEDTDIPNLWNSLNNIALVQHRRPWAQVNTDKFDKWGALHHLVDPTSETTKVWIYVEPVNGLAQNLRGGIQEISPDVDVAKIISELKDAYSSLFKEQSAELEALADLYERFPRFLKVFGAPEVPTREAHVLARLRHDVSRRRAIPGWGLPFEWCLRLFKAAIEQRDALKIDERLPPNLSEHLIRALEGVDFIYCPIPGKRLNRTSGDTAMDAAFVQYPFSNGALPKPKAEIAWLESFVTVTEWMAKEFPDITHLVASNQLPILRRRLLADPSDHRLFIEHESPRTVAQQLRADLQQCKDDSATKSPSLLALYMPPWPASKAIAIAQFLAPYRDCNHDVLQLLYESKIFQICRFIDAAPGRKAPEDVGLIVADEIIQGGTHKAPEETTRGPTSDPRVLQPQESINQRELIITANTLQQLFKDTKVSVDATGSEILAHILARVEESVSKQDAQNNAPWKTTVKNYAASQNRHMAFRDCYICSRRLIKPHQTISSMCVPCGDFNLAGSQLSLPPRLSLAGKIAAVTGARVNLGYHVTLRLLRCGARVIASTRYPHDALLRYKAEKDAEEWMDRLVIVGADFRSARDAFELAREITRIVKGWGGTLHILINNAAQTLTDSIEKERSSVKNEEKLKGSQASKASHHKS
ncbi:hypothetical protein ONZ43_g7163 [Nemania bipapillata]|uniref:Uncharacterized protein n=1 Tax=Nemania bipapillata TaxID=110536 RepID=A0ACC2HUD8_9PEZI|nr:hypothetical protein ONZ43_g7163 [Nemania bipapillata]